MSERKHAKTSWVAKLWPKRLTVGFGIAVCVALLITEVIFLIPASYVWHKSNQDEAVEEVRMAWYHASDPAAFLSVEHKSRLGQRMMRDGLLLGGVVYDSAGDPLAVFGERPVLDLNIARLSGQNIQISPTSAAIDVHFGPEDTGLSHDLVVRLPSEPIEAATFVQLRNFALSVLFIAGLTAVLVVLASILLVISPLRAINRALRQAVENPDNADQYQLTLHRTDEIGQMAETLNMLLTSVSVVYQDELASLKHAIEGFGFAILQFDAEDRMVAANQTAISMFNQNDFDGLRGMNRFCAQPLGARGSKPLPLTDLLGETSEPMLLTLHTDTSFFTGMGFGTCVRRVDGSVMHRFVAIMDMEEILRDSRRALGQSKKAEDAVIKAKTQAEEMRRLLESCLCLLDKSEPDPDNFSTHFLPDRILNDWYHEAERDGLVSGTLEHGLLPPLSGDPQVIRNVLRQAMLLTYGQSRVTKPVLKVDARRLGDDQVEFTVLDVSDKRQGVGAARNKKTLDPTLPTAALQTALGQAKGTFGGINGQGETSKVSFVLAAAKTMVFDAPMSKAG